MITNIFHPAVGISFQCLSDILILLNFHIGLLVASETVIWDEITDNRSSTISVVHRFLSITSQLNKSMPAESIVKSRKKVTLKNCYKLAR